ncbi:MAG: hypothetical protein QXG38_00365 [Candidatus Hadarchaeales archaeon]
MKGKHDGLSEYISREARIRLLEIVVGHTKSVRNAASLIGVSHTAVRKWLADGGTHPSNASLSKIMEVAFHFDGRRVNRILSEDLSTHERMVKLAKVLSSSRRSPR